MRPAHYQAVFKEPCDLSPEEIQSEAVKRARTAGFKVEDNPPIGISRHTFKGSDRWSCLIATIKACIPAGAESHPSAGVLGQWLPTAVMPARRRSQRSGAM